MSRHSEHSNKFELNGGLSLSAAINRDLEKGPVDPTGQESITSPNSPADVHTDSLPSGLMTADGSDEVTKQGKLAHVEPPKNIEPMQPTTQSPLPDQKTPSKFPPAREDVSLDPASKGARVSPQSPESDIPASLDQFTTFWKAYNADADAQDKEIVDTLGGDLDVLLVFAGLFSASNVAFIIEAYKDLKPDNVDTTNDLLRANNDLLRALIQNQSSISNPISVDITQFTVTPRAIRVNALFFTSLSCSLLTALGAVLGKQWLNHYKREGRRMTLAERGRERQRKFMGLELWHLEQVVETLPTLLQLSLFLFLGALIDFLWTINRTIAGVMAGFSIVTFCFYAMTTTIAVFFPSSPFQTRFSSLLRTIGQLCRRFLAWFRGLTLPQAWASIQNYSSIFVTSLRPRHNLRPLPLDASGKHADSSVPASTDDELSLECISWLLATSTVEKTISLASTAALMLPQSIWEKTNQVPNALRLMLRARIFESKVILDVRPSAVKTILELLHALVMKLNRTSEQVVPSLGDNRLFVTAFENMLWRVVKAGPVEGKATIQILEMLFTLGFTVEPCQQEIDLLYQGAFQTLIRDKVMSSELGSTVFLESPMKVPSIVELLGLPADLDMTTALQPLRSILLIDEGGFIRFSHHLAESFFTDPTRYQNPDFETTSALCHTKLALDCINHMRKYLPRNNMGVDNHLILNKDISGLETKPAEAGVSESLQYACRHWATHLQFSSPRHPKLLGAMQEFCATALLPWLEVMSLLGRYDETAFMIGRAETWMRSGDSSNVTTIILQDMHRFIMLFKGLMKPSAASIYSIALPLTYPSELHSHYHDGSTSLRVHPKGLPNFWTCTSKVIRPHVNSAIAFAVSHDNGYGVSGSLEGTVDLFTMRDGQCITKLEGHSDRVRSVAFAQDGNIVSGSNDRTINVWDAGTRSLKFTLEGHSDDVIAVDVSPDNKYIVSGSDDTTVRLWDARTGSHVATMEGHSNLIWVVLFSPDGREILSASWDTTVCIWNTADRTLLGRLNHPTYVMSAVFSSDGTLIATGSEDNKLRIWSAKSYSLTRTLEGHSGSITSLALSTDNKSIAGGSAGGIIWVWDVLDGSVQTILEGHSERIKSISFTPDQRYIVSASTDGTIRTWNWNDPNNNVRNNPVGHTSRITKIAFCSNGRILASGGDNGEVHIWNVGDMAHVIRLDGLSEPVRSITFSSDGRYITASSSKLTISWNLDTHQTRQTTSGLASSSQSHHISAEHSIEYGPGEEAYNSAVEYRLALGKSGMLYAKQFSAGRKMRSKDLLKLPVPNISASEANGYQLAVGTKGGQIMILDFAPVFSFEAITYDEEASNKETLAVE